MLPPHTLDRSLNLKHNPDVFGRLHDGGGARFDVLKHGDSLLQLARERLGVVESDGVVGSLSLPAHVPAV